MTDISKVASPIAGLRFHDLRHHAITELAESTTSDQTIMSIAGHVSPRMLAHYSHVRLEAKRAAVANLSKDSESKSHVTIDVYKTAKNKSEAIASHIRSGRGEWI